MLDRRKAFLGYLTYAIASRMVRRAVRRKAHSAVTTLASRRTAAPGPRPRRGVPLAGALVALAAAAAALVAWRRLGDGDPLE